MTSLPMRDSMSLPRRRATSRTRSFSRSPLWTRGAFVMAAVAGIEDHAPDLQAQGARQRTGRVA